MANVPTRKAAYLLNIFFAAMAFYQLAYHRKTFVLIPLIVLAQHIFHFLILLVQDQLVAHILTFLLLHRFDQLLLPSYLQVLHRDKYEYNYKHVG